MIFKRSTIQIIFGFFLIGTLVNLTMAYGLNQVTEIEVYEDLEGPEDEESLGQDITVFIDWSSVIGFESVMNLTPVCQLNFIALKRDFRDEPSPPPESNI